MRIIGGRLGGRRIRAPAGSHTRPTSDRVREAIFNILGPPPPDARVLDAFAGAGTLGLEALSRGAAHVTFIDSSRTAVKTLRANIAALGVGHACAVHVADTLTLLRRWHAAPPPGRFHWVFLDPPYRTDLADQALRVLGDGRLIEPGGVVVVEHDRRRPPDLRPDRSPGGLERADHRRYGDSGVSFYRLPAPPPPPPLDPERA